jgi:holo-[acyl-carrier protein] synthase
VPQDWRVDRAPGTIYGMPGAFRTRHSFGTGWDEGLLLVIVGLGSDLCNIDRIANSLERFGERFVARVFTDTERAKAERRPFTRAGTYAKRFAAKEAFAKAVGTGFKRGVFMRDIGVVNVPSGQPTLALTGGAKQRLDALVPPGHRAHIHLTMTDDHPFAMAVVIIEAIPEEPRS